MHSEMPLCIPLFWFYNIPFYRNVAYKVFHVGIKPRFFGVRSEGKRAYLTMSREETLWLLLGVNLTLKDLLSPGWRSMLWTKEGEGPWNPEPLLSGADFIHTHTHTHTVTN